MSPRSILPLVLAGLGCAAACHEAGPTAEITERRVAAVPSRFVVPGAGAAQRFRAEMGDMGAPGASASPADSLAYDLPTGWQKLPPTSDRMINLRPGGDPDASCYVTFLPESASGLEANVNR